VDAEERAAMAMPGTADGNAPEGLLEDICGFEGSDDDMDDSQGSAVARDDHILLSADEELERYFDEVAPGDVVISAMQTEDMSATGHASQFAQLLKDLMPLHIVFYDPYLPCVREVQIHQAAHPETRLNVYMMLFKGAFQEQQFLSSIRHEKEAFQHVIHAKRVMAFPVDQDGRLGQRQRNERQLAVRPEEENVSTRRAGGRVLDAPRAHPRVIVDMREFRSSLPGILHEVGLDIEPRTLLVGDYILSPEICVERKSLADLIGSLASGRLYSQAESMTRHYKRAALLIEFDEDKPFSLLESQQRLTNDIDFRSTMSKLALLTLSFPALRILWSHSPHATARIFLALKQHHREPDGAAASAIGVEALSAGGSSEYATEPQAMLRQLPGITPGNMYLVMEKVKSLRELCSLPLERLQELCGPKLGKQLHGFINNMPQSTENEPAPKRRA
jgi:DNA excision repair protein ERCC-4